MPQNQFTTPNKPLTQEQTRVLLSLLNRQKTLYRNKIQKEQIDKTKELADSVLNSAKVKTLINQLVDDLKKANKTAIKLYGLNLRTYGYSSIETIFERLKEKSSLNKDKFKPYVSESSALKNLKNKYDRKYQKLEEYALEVEMAIVGLQMSYSQAVNYIDTTLKKALR